MTEKQKKLAIIIGTIVIAILFLMSRKGAGASNSTIVNHGEMPAINVTIPSMNMPERSPIAINIPALPAFTPYQFAAISPCMCNGAGSMSSSNDYSGPLVEFVTNQADQGNNIYNYYAPVAPAPAPSSHMMYASF